MRKGYVILGTLTAAGAIGHYSLWSVFPDEKTAWAALILWVMLGVGHLGIYAIQAARQNTLAAAVAIPALIRIGILPALLVGLFKLFEPHVKVFVLLFVGEVLFFMGLELALVYRVRTARSSS